MSEIAKIVGVTKASLYYFFQDKEALFISVLEGAVTEALDEVQALKKMHKSDEALRLIIHKLIALGQEKQIFTHTRDLCYIKKQKQPKKLFLLIERLKYEIQETLSQNNVADPKMATDVLLHAIKGYLSQGGNREGVQKPEVYADYLFKLLTRK